MNFQPILDCFTPYFKLKYEDSENIKADHVNTVVVNLHQIRCRTFFMGHPVSMRGNLSHTIDFLGQQKGTTTFIRCSETKQHMSLQIGMCLKLIIVILKWNIQNWTENSTTIMSSVLIRKLWNVMSILNFSFRIFSPVLEYFNWTFQYSIWTFEYTGARTVYVHRKNTADTYVILLHSKTSNYRNSIQFQFKRIKFGKLPTLICSSGHDRKSIMQQINYMCLDIQEILAFLTSIFSLL